MPDPFDDLTHLVYEASLDNSLWPELILELTEQVQRAKGGQFLTEDRTGSLENLSQHVRRAFSISKRMVELQERETYLSSVLNACAFGVALFDDQGQLLMANQSMQEILPDRVLSDGAGATVRLQPPGGQGRTLRQWVETCNQSGAQHNLQLGDGTRGAFVMLPRADATRIGFPSVAAGVLLAVDPARSDALRSLTERFALTRREAELVGALAADGELKSAAASMRLSYESARTYLKRIYDKTGCRSQADLLAALANTPAAFLRQSQPQRGEGLNVRRLLHLRDGRRLEYFLLGPEQGRPVVLFDALSGVTVDVIGYPEQCLEHLERHGVRLIVPCRPGGFRSDPKPMDSLADFAPDVAELLDHLGVGQVGIMSISFGSGSALAVARELGTRVSKLVLSSAAYPTYRHRNWRELDQFYHMSAILGRHWPSMLRQIIPFLVRSILQNRDRYFDRYCNRTRSQDDIRILSQPVIRRRTAEMLEQRTAAGMEGMVEENLLNTRGWDFPVDDILPPVELFHGVVDNVAPVEGAELLSQHLPNASLHRMADKGHYHHITNWPWLAARAAGRDVTPDSDRYCIPDP